jgi:hypothetical protein
VPYIEHDGKRILFVHIPKTGGTSVESWMSSISPLRLYNPIPTPGLRLTPQHLRMTDIEAMFGADYFDFVFAIVRDPYKRIESEFKMRTERSADVITQKGRFNTWLDRVQNMAKTDPFFLDGHLIPQWEYVTENCAIYRFEDGIESIMKDVAEKTGLPLPDETPHHLSSSNFNVEINWTSNSIIAVNQKYRADFENFDYGMRTASLKSRIVHKLKS